MNWRRGKLIFPDDFKPNGIIFSGRIKRRNVLVFKNNIEVTEGDLVLIV
jgi:hypothetical protein